MIKIKLYFNKYKKLNVDPVIGYSFIALVWIFILLVNMKEYMFYLSIKYNNTIYIQSNYAYNLNGNDLLEPVDLYSASEILDLNEFSNSSGDMTSWGGKVELYDDNKIVTFSNGYKNELIQNKIKELKVRKLESKKFEIKNNIKQTLNNSGFIDLSLKSNNEGVLISNKSINNNIVKISTNENNNLSKNVINISNKSELKTENIDSNISKVDKTVSISNIIKSPVEVQVIKSLSDYSNNSTKTTINIVENDIKSYETVKTVEANSQPILVNEKKIVSSSNDSISISINNEINNVLYSLNTEVFDGFVIKILNNRNLVLENGTWYTYVFSNYQGFGSGIIPTQNELENGGISKITSILLINNDNTINFVNNYKKVKLISDDIIQNISNKETFLKELADDKKFLQDDTDNLFIKLKNDTLEATKGLSDNSKIQKLYAYVLKNVSYSKVFDINNKYIFSGIYTYKNGDGICSGYSKMYLYMLSFAGIDNAKLVKGHVLDAPDFPNIGHAWIQIGNSFYDPTFDDPIGNNNTKDYSEYKYFGLPKDLFYSNRFNYGSLPSNLKNASMDIRKNYIENELDKLLTKYINSDYNILKPLIFKQKNGFGFDDKITIEKLKLIIPNFEVNDFKYSFDNKEILINDIKYYTVSDSNIESILENIGYKIDGLKLFKWDNGTYRLAYKVS